MKKLLCVIMACVMVLSFCACGEKAEENKGKKITLYGETYEGDDVRLAVDFYYPEDGDITLEKQETPNWVKFKLKSKNLTLSPSITEDTTFADNKEYAKENEETYKEFKLNGYDCYAYEDFGGYWIYVHLEQDENLDRYIVLQTEATDFSKKAPEGAAQYEDEVIKKICESFVYNGVVKYPPEKNAETTK